MLQPVTARPRVRVDLSSFGDVVRGVTSIPDAYLGLDLSLTSSGAATLRHGRSQSCVMSAGIKGFAKLRGAERLSVLRSALDAQVYPRPKLIAIEGYSFGSKNGSERIGEWGGVARLTLYDMGLDFIEVPPTSLKRFITGSGNAEKSHVAVQLHKRYGVEVPGSQNDRVDAVCLSIFALAWDRPDCLPLTQVQREVIEKMRKDVATGCNTA